MPQVTIYLDDDTNQLLSDACATQGKSKSAIAAEAIRRTLANRLPPEWFKLLGSWDDERAANEILNDIRSGSDNPERPSID